MHIYVYAACPQSKDLEASQYLRAVADVSRWSEAARCAGILIYTDNGIVDPWLVSQVVIESTERLTPLVAIQPVYMHPYSAAKMVASLAFLHGRAVCLNMLAGGFKNDLLALGDQTPHDERYERTVEYTQILMALLQGTAPVTVDGGYYRVTNLKMAPPVPAELVPEVLISGSSPAGLAAARTLGATPVKYPRPPGEEESWLDDDFPTGFGVRVGIIARRDADKAWRIAHDRFPKIDRGRSRTGWRCRCRTRSGTSSCRSAGTTAETVRRMTSRILTGSGRFRTTRPSAPTSWAAMNVSGKCWRITWRSVRERSSSTSLRPRRSWSTSASSSTGRSRKCGRSRK